MTIMYYRSAYLSTLAAFILAATIIWGGVATAQNGAPSEAKPQLRLIIDYGDGAQKHFVGFAWREGLTVLDLLKAADRHPHGIDIEYRGQGATAFLTKIDDLENEGSGKNWIFRVNGKLADRSFAVFELKRGDTILWKFGEYR
jgi:hypothetical protein